VATAEAADGSVDLTVRLVADEVDRAAAYGVRHEVFVGEQGVPLDIERDEHDDTAEHAVAFDGEGRCVGAGRLLVGDGGVATVGRMAVRAGARGSGVGAALLACLEQRARELGAHTVELHAQTHARGFYERAGYEVVGEEYEEAGLPHVDMRRSIT
jgi:predicted GNAT family N-acyltransferase